MLLNFNKTCCLKLVAALIQHPKSFNLAMLSCPSQSVLELLSDDARFNSHCLGSMIHYFGENSACFTRPIVEAAYSKKVSI